MATRLRQAKKRVEAVYRAHVALSALYKLTSPGMIPEAYKRRLDSERIFQKAFEDYAQGVMRELPSLEVLVSMARGMLTRVSKRLGPQEELVVEAISRLIERHASGVGVDPSVIDRIGRTALDEVKTVLALDDLQYHDVRTVYEDLKDPLLEDVTRKLRIPESLAGTLAQHIVSAANPARPMPMDELDKVVTLAVGGFARRAARTGVAYAYGRVSHESMYALRIGERRWLTASGSPAAAKSPVCVVCLENAGAGWVPLDKEFPSGHIHPPAHAYIAPILRDG